VNRREYEFNIRFSGSWRSFSGSDEVRRRDVCRGYDAVCSDTATPVKTLIQESNNGPMVTVRDYNDTGNLIATVTLTIPAAGAQGYLRVKGIEHYLWRTERELPAWFINNRWYQYFIIRASAGETPGATTPCTPGAGCLKVGFDLNGDDVADVIKDNIRLLVIYTGVELKNPPLIDQSWLNGNTTDSYLDLPENRNHDDTFLIKRDPAKNNDRFRLAVSCPPPDNSKLCWSE